jgi:hypothetical protein
MDLYQKITRLLLCILEIWNMGAQSSSLLRRPIVSGKALHVVSVSSILLLNVIFVDSSSNQLGYGPVA